MLGNTINFSPVVKSGLCKAHPLSMEFHEWWDDQRDRCINGYTVDGITITGDHYWYLNFWKIKGINVNTGRKDLVSPRFLDIDFEFFHALDKARKNGKNMCIVKRRQAGYSEKLASLVGKEFSVFRNSQSIITAGEDKYCQNTMKMTIRGINSLKGTEFFKRRLPDTIDYIQAKYKVIEEGIPSWKGSMSEVYCITSKNNTQATVGKCFGENTLVLMHNGSIKMIQDIKVGDLVMGPDSLSRTVLSTHFGIDNLYRIKQVAGNDYIVNSKHDLVFQHSPLVRNRNSNRHGKFITNNFNDCDSKNENGNLIIEAEKYFSKAKTFKRYCYRKQTAVDYQIKRVELAPYFLGLWLGDGDSDEARITNIDKEILDYLCNTYSHSIGNKKGTDCKRIYIRNTIQTLKKMNLIKNKHIPLSYMCNSKSMRLQLLAGLIDSDGYLFNSGAGYEIATKFDRLKDDILMISRSLGFWCTCKSKRIKNKNYWIIHITGKVSEIPVLIQRKKCIKQSKKNTIKGISISKEGVGKYYGFECSGDHLFLLSDFTVVHNSPSLIIFEEAGRFPGLKESFNFIKPALEANFQKTGIAIIVGTGGDMDKGADELEEIFFDPTAYDMLEFDNIYREGDPADMKKICYFVPAWKYAIIDVDGNSLFEPSMKKIESDRDAAAQAKDSNKLIRLKTQMPLNPDEAFMRTGNSLFDVALLNAQLALLRNSRELNNIAQRGRLEWIRDNSDKIIGIEWFADNNGPFIIYEHPAKDAAGNVFLNLYKGATDSYDKDQANTSSSKGSCQIFKAFKDVSSISRTFVARVTIRPKKAEDFYDMSAKLCYYYKAPNLIEWSNIGIFGWYERNHLDHFLRERPRIAYSNVKVSQVNNKFGIDPGTKPYWLTAYRDYIKDNSHKMLDQEQIIAAINYRDEKGYNCDITISSALCIVHELDDRHLAVKSAEKKKDGFVHYTSKNGKITMNFN